MSFSWPWALLSLLIIPIVGGVVWLVRRQLASATGDCGGQCPSDSRYGR